jgi:hypothetical protein
VAGSPDVELEIAPALRLSDASEVALEDYARALTGARRAEARRDGDAVVAVRLSGLAREIVPAAKRDVLDFARGLAVRDGGPGLGWS